MLLILCVNNIRIRAIYWNVTPDVSIYWNVTRFVRDLCKRKMTSDLALYVCVINFQIFFYFSTILFFRICSSHRDFVRVEIKFSTHFSFWAKRKSIWQLKIFNHTSYCHQILNHTNRCNVSSLTIDEKIVEMRVDFEMSFFRTNDETVFLIK